MCPQAASAAQPPFRSYSCTWCQGDEALASIGVGIEADTAFLAKAGAAVLTFQWRRRETAEWTQACQRVPIVWTKCDLGGARPWFLCPEDTGDGRCCGRRVAKLYTGDSHLFACRQCRRLAYASQSESPHDRSIQRVRKTQIWPHHIHLPAAAVVAPRTPTSRLRLVALLHRGASLDSLFRRSLDWSRPGQRGIDLLDRPALYFDSPD